MSFREYLKKDVFGKRLEDNRILVIFDKEERYGQICIDMESDICTVINTVGRPVSSRIDAMKSWQDLCQDSDQIKTLLIYTCDEAPQTQEEKIVNPFSAYVAMGAQFPHSAADDYEQLCHSFLPERRLEIEQLFDTNSEPDIDHIDNLQSGTDAHPRLQSIFGTASVEKILENFLVPKESIADELESSNDWVNEMKKVLKNSLDYELNSQITNVKTIRDKLWQYILFSEFSDDLPGDLPPALDSVPKANGSASRFACTLCKTLREVASYQNEYKNNATRIEADLQLAHECQSINDLGDCDTFAFEEAKYLKHAVVHFINKRYDESSDVLTKHKHSLWTQEGERGLLWKVLEYSINLIRVIAHSKERLRHLGPTGSELAQMYNEDFSRVDTVHREFMTSVEFLEDHEDEVAEMIEFTNEEYRRFVNEIQEQLINAVSREGWPFEGIEDNRHTFKDVVQPKLDQGYKVAYFLIDALRLELFNELNNQLGKDFEVNNTVVCAQLPCVTRFGMAALVPGASDKLRFRAGDEEELNPFIDDFNIASRKNRLEVFDRHLGDRTKNFTLSNFIESTKTPARRANFKSSILNTDLVVITSTELDEIGEANEHVIEFLKRPIARINLAIKKCSDLGFDYAVVATDHGFLWFNDIERGHVCDRPSMGEWKLEKRRCFVGDGEESSGSVKFDTNHVGIPTECPAYIVPRLLGVYSMGNEYFHEGLSFQESMIGRLEIKFEQSENISQGTSVTEGIEISRKRKKVSSLIMSVNLSWPGESDLFQSEQDKSPEFRIEVRQGNNDVGRLVPGDEAVDVASDIVRIKRGQSIKVTISLDASKIEPGDFRINLIDLNTDKSLDKLELQYDSII